MHVEQLGEIVPPPRHNTVGVCNQVAFIILHYITSSLVPLLKVTDAPIQAPNILDLTVSFKFLNFSSQICFLSLKCLLTSRLTLFRLSTLFWLGSCIHCILARFLWSKKPKHSSLNQGLFCFNSCRPRLYYHSTTTTTTLLLLCQMYKDFITSLHHLRMRPRIWYQIFKFPMRIFLLPANL